MDDDDSTAVSDTCLIGPENAVLTCPTRDSDHVLVALRISRSASAGAANSVVSPRPFTVTICIPGRMLHDCRSLVRRLVSDDICSTRMVTVSPRGMRRPTGPPGWKWMVPGSKLASPWRHLGVVGEPADSIERIAHSTLPPF